VKATRLQWRTFSFFLVPTYGADKLILKGQDANTPLSQANQSEKGQNHGDNFLRTIHPLGRIETSTLQGQFPDARNFRARLDASKAVVAIDAAREARQQLYRWR